MSATEQTTYHRAIELGMELGYHTKFLEIHTEPLGDLEAHLTCGFMFWHRKFILAYENMLRSLGPEFECVTLPYWDYFSDYAKRLAGLCQYMEGCSEIMKAFGGSDGVLRTPQIQGRSIPGKCVSHQTTRHFCESTNHHTQSDCLQCIPRGNWTDIEFPGGLGYASLVNLISARNSTFRQANIMIQRNPHNTIHNAIGGVMPTTRSPSDPIFYSHHSTIDLLHHLYYECHIGRRLTTIEKQTDPRAFEWCNATAAMPLKTANSSIHMMWFSNGTATDPHEDPVLGPFFQGLGKSYYEYVDLSDLGKFSIQYEVNDLMQHLTQNGLACPAQSTSSRSRKLNTHTLSFIQQQESESKAIRWYDKAFSQMIKQASSKQDALLQLEIMECVYHAHHIGDVGDYSATFRASNAISPTDHLPCKQHLLDLKHHKASLLQVSPEWEKEFAAYFQ